MKAERIEVPRRRVVVTITEFEETDSGPLKVGTAEHSLAPIGDTSVCVEIFAAVMKLVASDKAELLGAGR